ncbi:nuclease-related domain-containing protein [Vibrio sinaloensis]|nr:nuclease-related domain-containing protein [Vibrio sinaloensis]
MLVSKYGVFVIETKNMKGWIFRFSETALLDTEKYSSTRLNFKNPLHQKL